MEKALIRVGHYVVNLLAVASAHWESSTLFVHLVGGRFLSFKGEEAKLLWSALDAEAFNLETGELKE